MAKKVAQLLFGVFLLGLIFIYLDIPVSYLLQIDVVYWFVMAAISLLMLCVLSLQFKIGFTAVRLYLSNADAFMLTSSNSFFNLTLPFKIGLALRAAFMKKYYGVGIANYSVLMIVTQLVSLLGAAIVLFSVMLVDRRVDALVAEHASWAGVALILLLLACLFGAALYFGAQKYIEALPANGSWYFVVAITAAVFVVFSGGRLMVSAFALNEQAISDLSIYFLMASVSSIALVFSLTPGNLGVREGLFMAVGALVGLPVEEVAKVAILDRLVSSVVVVVFGMGSTVLLARRVNV